MMPTNGMILSLVGLLKLLYTLLMQLQLIGNQNGKQPKRVSHMDQNLWLLKLSQSLKSVLCIVLCYQYHITCSNQSEMTRISIEGIIP